MKTAIKAKPGFLVPDSYLALIRKYPLRAVKNESDYDEASAVLDNLALRDDLDEGEEQYLEALEVLISAYDDKHAPELSDRRSPLERLKALMAASGATAVDLRTILDSSQPLVSMILSGERDLSKKAIARLSAYFKIDPGYFL